MDTAESNVGAEAVAAPEPKKPAPVFTVEADGSRVRKLLKPIISHNGTVDTIKLRKPTYREVMTIGDPETLVVVNGGYVPQIDMVLIERYIGTLSGIDPALLEQADYMDALALRDAVRSFFQRVT
jgi:hypothetical protein